MLTKEFHFNYNHLEREAWFYKILVISYGIQANIILLKSGIVGVRDWVGVDEGGGT